MILLFFISGLTLHLFDTFALITGGLINNVWMIAGLLFGVIGMIIFSLFMGVGIVCLFPIHWAIITRPDNILLLLALVLPWIISSSIASWWFAHSPRGGIHTSLAIGIGYFILMLIPYLILIVLFTKQNGLRLPHKDKHLDKLHIVYTLQYHQQILFHR